MSECTNINNKQDHTVISNKSNLEDVLGLNESIKIPVDEYSDATIIEENFNASNHENKHNNEDNKYYNVNNKSNMLLDIKDKKSSYNSYNEETYEEDEDNINDLKSNNNKSLTEKEMEKITQTTIYNKLIKHLHNIELNRHFILNSENCDSNKENLIFNYIKNVKIKEEKEIESIASLLHIINSNNLNSVVSRRDQDDISPILYIVYLSLNTLLELLFKLNMFKKEYYSMSYSYILEGMPILHLSLSYVDNIYNEENSIKCFIILFQNIIKEYYSKIELNEVKNNEYNLNICEKIEENKCNNLETNNNICELEQDILSKNINIHNYIDRLGRNIFHIIFKINNTKIFDIISENILSLINNEINNTSNNLNDDDNNNINKSTICYKNVLNLITNIYQGIFYKDFEGNSPIVYIIKYKSYNIFIKLIDFMIDLNKLFYKILLTFSNDIILIDYLSYIKELCFNDKNNRISNLLFLIRECDKEKEDIIKYSIERRDINIFYIFIYLIFGDTCDNKTGISYLINSLINTIKEKINYLILKLSTNVFNILNKSYSEFLYKVNAFINEIYNVALNKDILLNDKTQINNDKENNNIEDNKYNIDVINKLSYITDKVVKDIINNNNSNNQKLKTLVITDSTCINHTQLIYNNSFERAVLRDKTMENSDRLVALLSETTGSLKTNYFKKYTDFKHTSEMANIADITRVHSYNYIINVKNKCDSLRKNFDITKAFYSNILENKESENIKNDNNADFFDYNNYNKIFKRNYINNLYKSIEFDRDTMINSFSFKSALIAAGCALEAVEKVYKGNYVNAFAVIRPPGHHAGYFGKTEFCDSKNKHYNDNMEVNKTSNGFCFFNNAIIAAAYLRYKYKIKIAIVDFDVHHGNGSEELVRNLHGNNKYKFKKENHLIGSYETNLNICTPWLNFDDKKNILFISLHGYDDDDPNNFYPCCGSNESKYNILIY